MFRFITSLFAADTAPATRTTRLGLESMDERAVPAVVTVPNPSVTAAETRAIIIEGGHTTRGFVVEGGNVTRGIIIEGGLSARGIISIN